MRDLCVDSPAKGGRRLDAYLTRTSPPTAKTRIPAGRGMGSCDTGNQFVESSLGPTPEVGGSTLGYDTGTNGLTCPVGSTRRLGQASLELTHRGRNKWQRCPANGSFSGRPKVSSFFFPRNEADLDVVRGLTLRGNRSYQQPRKQDRFGFRPAIAMSQLRAYQRLSVTKLAHRSMNSYSAGHPNASSVPYFRDKNLERPPLDHVRSQPGPHRLALTGREHQ